MNEKKRKEKRFNVRTDEDTYNTACKNAEALNCSLSSYINSCVKENKSNLDRTAVYQEVMKIAIILEKIEKQYNGQETNILREELLKLCGMLNS